MTAVDQRFEAGGRISPDHRRQLGISKLEPYEFLREKNNGQAAGLTEAAAKALYQQPPTLKELHHRNYPGGETRQEFYDRNVQGLIKCADLERENLLIVAHKGTIQNIIFHWLGLDIAAVNVLNFSCRYPAVQRDGPWASTNGANMLCSGSTIPHICILTAVMASLSFKYGKYH